MKTSFFVRIALLRGTFNLAVQLRTISAKAFRAPRATSQNSEVLRGVVC